ncbi:MAG: hydrogen peroxide-inducible genes activator [Betaproteobacteria bacterium]|nr:hydrogen peroxide-inducible genes activator [Betaproteobacteria bacterium]
MTLTDLRYLVALARERHFGRAAQACFVSQPTLSVAIKKLEDELGVTLFERSSQEVRLTEIGERVAAQAQRALVEAALVKEVAAQGRDPLAGPLRLRVIYTIGPYLLPRLIALLHQRAPRMPLLIQENFTARLAEGLRRGDLDVIVVSQPFQEPGVVTRPVYDEPFRVLLPAEHPWAARGEVAASELADEPMLLLGAGNCFRDQVLEVCPRLGQSVGLQRTLEGSSLETIRHMVASGAGITVLPSSAADPLARTQPLLRVKPFATPEPSRRVVLAWRASFPRTGAIDVLSRAIAEAGLPGVRPAPLPGAMSGTAA